MFGAGNPTLIVLTPILGPTPGFTIDGFDGNNKSGSVGWIDIESFTPLSGGSTTVQSGGKGAGHVDLHDITVTKMLDRASPKLFEACSPAQPQVGPLCGGLPSTGTWTFVNPGNTVGLGVFFDLIPDASGAFGSGAMSFTVQTAPEPCTVLLVGVGLVMLTLARKKAFP
jgi:hypothetical protein